MNDSQHDATHAHPHHNPGMAGSMARAFITSPLSLLLLLAFFAVGVLGMWVTPRQEDPQISVPMVDIFVRYPGASAQEVENLISRPLESIMYEMTGVDHVYSYSAREQSMVTVQFIVGEQLESSLVKLYDKLESNKDKIPFGVQTPLVKPKGADDVPLVTLTLWSNQVDDANLRLVALDVLQSLREVKNTSQSFIVDGRHEELKVEILPERLATFGVSLEQVANAIRMANSERNTGAVEPDQRVFRVYSGAFLNSAEDVKRLMVAVIDGRPVYVRDVATVTEEPSDAGRSVGYYTGSALASKEVADNAPAVTLAIAKKHGTNGVDVANAVLDKLNVLKGRIIPDNVNVAVTRNYGETAKAKVDELILKLFVATGIVTLLVWFFLGIRAAFVVLIVIPAVITTTVFSAWIMGMTIDRVSLFALIFSIGILVDDAIVVVENIYRRWLLIENTDVDTAVDAVREVGNPTILATGTVIAALLPMGFVSGMMGPYMLPIPVLGSVAMVISLFAAFAFTPWLTNRFKPSLRSLHDAAEKEHKQAAKMEKLFRGMIVPLVTNRTKGMAFLIGIIVVFFICMLLFYPLKSVRVKMLPLDNKPEFNVVLNMPEGTALPVTANLVHTLATKLKEIPEVTALQTYVGTASPFNFNGLVRHYYLRQQPWQADIQVQLTDKHDRKRTSHEIAVEARALLQPLLEGSNGKLQVVEMPPGPPVLQSVVAEIYGPDANTRRQVAADLTKMFEEAENLDDVDNLMEEDHQILRFQVDSDKAQRNGITAEDVNRTLEMAMGGFILGDIKKNALIDPTRIVMQVPLSARSQIYRLSQLPVTNRTGQFVPLHELGTFVFDQQDKPIYRKDLRAVEFVTAETVGRLAAPVYGQSQVEDLLAKANNGAGYVTPDGTKLVDEAYWLKSPQGVEAKTAFEWGGEWTVTWETFRDMGIAFAAALVLIYMLIVAQFGNFTLPAIIMAPIPLTLIGIVPGHWLMNAEFTATSMIGFIALAGIIVRNSILLVDFAREAVASGETVLEAVIHSCEARTRPIVITALALFGGSMVILSDPIFQGMAVSLIFGGAVATLLTLLIIPLGCISAGESMHVCPDPRDPTGGGAGGATPESSKPRKSVAKMGKSVVTYAGMYGVSLMQSVAQGIGGLFAAGGKLMRKSKERKAAKREQERQQAKARVLAAAAAVRGNAKPAPAEPVAAVSAVVVESTAIEVASETSARQQHETEAAVQPVTEPAAEQQGESGSTTVDDAVSSSTESKERRKSPGRRGIKLKTDI
ncbi:MAG TPA: efflux RND transporter permease subunit [Candidatus Thiothrix moscowensis]|uniref:efflux RND transporter permease subunit n=1 Tax=unclassified Thiothrix TaxID=2636184 RepID=UPI0025E05A5B|nr:MULTISPECIES: efflux RND transporter permease subunit [unclassified Thiothrix]HRJ53475.1 efflux RND transporter permease subunit [Candidatus Thiothrix moscowensis]HRJ93554.1 efflux RND transporter permease subunit [Candidatus Thiothrix moscowensis]